MGGPVTEQSRPESEQPLSEWLFARRRPRRRREHFTTTSATREDHER